MIIMEDLYLNTSKPRKDVKKILGQANHFLITILIGLDYIGKNNITLPAEFRTSWNPKDKNRSVLRSREYALNSSLAWAVDCLDAYFSKINQSPFLIEDIELKNKIDRAGRSVYEKYKIFSDYIISNNFNKTDFLLYESFVDLAIQWRNNTTHYNAKNIIQEESECFLTMSPDFIKNEFCGLEIKETLKHFKGGKSPTFKEVTSLIRAIHKYIEILDSFLLSKIDIARYTFELLDKFFSENVNEKKSYPTLKSGRQDTKIYNILRGWSFSDNKAENGICLHNTILRQKIDELIKSWVKQ